MKTGTVIYVFHTEETTELVLKDRWGHLHKVDIEPTPEISLGDEGWTCERELMVTSPAKGWRDHVCKMAKRTWDGSLCGFGQNVGYGDIPPAGAVQ